MILRIGKEALVLASDGRLLGHLAHYEPAGENPEVLIQGSWDRALVLYAHIKGRPTISPDEIQKALQSGMIDSVVDN